MKLRIEKISENLRHLREIKISSRSTLRSFQHPNRTGAITIDFYSEIGVADAYFNAVNSAKICAICGKLKFRLGLPMRSF
jgi:hypothetical protein